MSTLRMRLSQLLLARGHDAIDQLERPDSAARQLLRDVDQAMQRARASLVQALATVKSARQETARCRDAERKATGQAREALATGDQAAAREHAGRAVRAAQSASESDAAAAQSERAVAALRDQLSSLRAERLRTAAASMRARTAQVLSGVVAGNAWTAAHERRQRLDACQAKADAAMHVVEAATELMRDDAGVTADDTSQVDALLDKLAAESSTPNKEI